MKITLIHNSLRRESSKESERILERTEQRKEKRGLRMWAGNAFHCARAHALIY